jgi:hypothetical protein
LLRRRLLRLTHPLPAIMEFAGIKESSGIKDSGSVTA